MECEQIVDAVRDWLDGEDWHYEYDADRQVIRSGVSLSSKIKSCKILILFHDDSYTVYLCAPISGDVDDLNELNKYLARANYGLRNGNFELDWDDGEIRYKVYVNCEGLETLPEVIVQESVLCGCAMMERYGNGIAALALGFSDADTEIQKAENSEDDAAEDGDSEE